MKIAEGAATMTETQLKAEMSWGGYHKIPNKTLSEVVTINMRAGRTSEIHSRGLPIRC